LDVSRTVSEILMRKARKSPFSPTVFRL